MSLRGKGRSRDSAAVVEESRKAFPHCRRQPIAVFDAIASEHTSADHKSTALSDLPVSYSVPVATYYTCTHPTVALIANERSYPS